MPENLFIFAIIFLGVLTQTVTGFGSALVIMAILPSLVGIQLAAPLVAMVGLTIEVILLIRLHQSLSIKAVLPLVIGSFIGIPIGVSALSRVDPELFLTILGVVIAGYAIYALLEIKLPELKSQAWAYLAGFLAGLLGGAYNTSGPPVIIYGNARRWPPLAFKSNLQGFFFANSIFVVTNHALRGNLNSEVWWAYLLALPAIALGILIGSGLDKRINPVLFRKLVLILLALMGVLMIFTNI